MKYLPVFLTLVFFSLLLPGCGVVEGIFKAGMYWAFFLVAAVIFLILWLVYKARKK
jgi:hypothetical protein